MVERELVGEDATGEDLPDASWLGMRVTRMRRHDAMISQQLGGRRLT